MESGNLNNKATSSDSTNLNKVIPRIPKAEDISTLFDKQRENMEQNRGSTFGKGGSLGFGFRGTIPKLPSFKVSVRDKRDSIK